FRSSRDHSGSGLAAERIFRGVIKAFPRGAALVDQLVESQRFNPVVNLAFVEAVGAKIMELIRNLLRIQPGASFFHRVAVFDSVNYVHVLWRSVGASQGAKEYQKIRRCVIACVRFFTRRMALWVAKIITPA